MIEVPAATPDTTPVPAPTVATAVFELDHAPPNGLLEIIIDWPSHTADGPEIGSGGTATVTTAVVKQEEPN